MKSNNSSVDGPVTQVLMSRKPDTRERTEVPPEFRWDFSAIFAGWTEWEEGMAQLDQKMDELLEFKGKISQSPVQLLEAYKAYDTAGLLAYRLYRYPQLQRDVDTRDQLVAGRFQRMAAVLSKFQASLAWFAPELLGLSDAVVENWIAQTPDLEPYRFPIMEAFRRRLHTLDERGERLLAMTGQSNDTPRMIYQELATSDIRFPTMKLASGADVLLSPGNYAALLLSNRDQTVRGEAAEIHLHTYGETANTYAAIYAGVLKRDWFLAKARNFKTTVEAALHPFALPPSVVETLIHATRAGTKPLQRYAHLRKQLLGLSSYHLYDSFLPIFTGNEPRPFEWARDISLRSVALLGDDYTEKYRRFLASGHIDVYENDGKKSGAYNAGVYGVGPYLLLNYNDTLGAAFTLAHEAGHAMHTVLSYETQPFATAEYTVFVAEVASITSERLLLDQCLREATSPNERFLLLQHALDSTVNTFYTQVLYAAFELRAHRLVEQDQPVTTETLNAMYLELLKEFWGEALTVDDFYKWTWARIPQLFNTPYYVYQYATSYASSAQLYNLMTTGSLEERASARERYLTLLRSGGNDQPMSQLKAAGVDLAQRQTIHAVIEQMDGLVSQMEAEAERLI